MILVSSKINTKGQEKLVLHFCVLIFKWKKSLESGRWDKYLARKMLLKEIADKDKDKNNWKKSKMIEKNLSMGVELLVIFDFFQIAALCSGLWKLKKN